MIRPDTGTVSPKPCACPRFNARYITGENQAYDAVISDRKSEKFLCCRLRCEGEGEGKRGQKENELESLSLQRKWPLEAFIAPL